MSPDSSSRHEIAVHVGSPIHDQEPPTTTMYNQRDFQSTSSDEDSISATSRKQSLSLLRGMAPNVYMLRRSAVATTRIINMASIFGTRSSRQQPPKDPLADREAAESSDEGSYHDNTDQVSEEGTDDAPRLNERPALAHHLQNDSAILALAVDDRYIYAGTQDGEIVVWSLASFELVVRIQAHNRAVLCLFLSADRKFLFSSAGDAIVNAWCPGNLKRLYHIYSTYDVGDVFSVAYSAQYQTVYLGAQNTSIQWCSLKDTASRPPPNPERHPDRRNHRFFDSVQAGGTSTPRPQPSSRGSNDGDVLEIDKAHMKHYAHYGYVYCMLMVRGASRDVDGDDDMLISGGGDGTIKLWKLSYDGLTAITEVARLGEDDAESVLSMAVDGSFLYSSKLQGVIELWDLDTKQKLRVIRAHNGDVMTLQMGWGYLWSAGSTGFARKYSTVQYGEYKNSSNFNQYHCLNRWRAHEGRILASATIVHNEQWLYITGSNDNSVSVWNVSHSHHKPFGKSESQESQLIKALQEFISFKTISSRPDHAEDCRRGATFLRTLFKQHGADTEMLNTDHHNPIVYAKFKGNQKTSTNRKKILFYGHYDVVPADDKQKKWIIDPFQMKGMNGYLYGRGVSDNKGPIMAALYGIVDLVHDQELESDITFLIEGEEESGSRGFKDAVRRNKALIGDIDYIILANSYWLDDEVPCLTYGLRGVLHATVKVDSIHPDVHSGVDGSFMMDEPLFDLTAILAKLKGLHNRIQIPGFYDKILPLTAAEEARYDDITETLVRRNPQNGPPEILKASLMARWREPNLTIHRYKVSGPDGSLVSSHASAAISLRVVPNQELEDVINSLTAFLHESFATLDTHNRLSITIDNQADAWLGDPENEIFRTLEEAIMAVWGPIGERRRASVPGPKQQLKPPTPVGISSPSLKPTPATTTTLTNGSDHTSLAASPLDPSETDFTTATRKKGRKPLYIREGGSIPSIRFLEKEFGAPAAHLPCGQASDSAHLDNERLRVTNLYNKRAKKSLYRIGQISKITALGSTRTNINQEKVRLHINLYGKSRGQMSRTTSQKHRRLRKTQRPGRHILGTKSSFCPCKSYPNSPFRTIEVDRFQSSDGGQAESNKNLANVQGFLDSGQKLHCIDISSGKFILRSFQSLGYQVQYNVLQAAEFGTPQARRRAIFSASLPSCPLPDLPQSTHCFSGRTLKSWHQNRQAVTHGSITIGAVITDLPKFEFKDPHKVCRQTEREEAEQVERQRTVTQYDVTEKYKFIGNNHQSYHSETLSEYQLQMRVGLPNDGLCNLVTQSFSEHEMLQNGFAKFPFILTRIIATSQKH
ncbi:hypothetical protein B7494_g4692 [Chlorociboria aeruginascens]|nr:hypothetical protein B7494_g4692 [Chlorociboria aeruginascens]